MFSSLARATKARLSACAFREPRKIPKGTMNHCMKILLADDHAVVRQGLKLILADHFKRATFGEARNAHEALALVPKGKWDVAVLDVTMPGRSGLEVLKEMKRLRPKM